MTADNVHPDPSAAAPSPNTTPSPFGAWASPISASVLTEDATSFLVVGSDRRHLHWLESRGQESGRTTLLRADGEATSEITPTPFSVRTRVHEYGGAAYVADDNNGLIVFSNFSDNRLYRVDRNHPEPFPITPAGPWRYADLQLDVSSDRLISVREDHTFADTEPVNTIVVLSPAGPNADGGRIIVSGSDFYAGPRLNADHTRLLWLAWKHPNMPWDGTELWSASIAVDNTLTDISLVAGGPRESVTQPQWDSRDRIVYVTDASGWWNLWRATPGDTPEPLTSDQAEFATPQWLFGMSNWTFVTDDAIFCGWTRNGFWRVGILEVASRTLTPIDGIFTEIGSVQRGPGTGTAVCIASSEDRPRRIIQYNAASGTLSELRSLEQQPISPGYIARAESVSWPTEDGQIAHGFLYLPSNKDFHASDGELPPLIVESHGGPTSSASAAFDLTRQYWTSRGFAILDVNYGGSTGYGRHYRERLNGNWGVVDVDDCVNGAVAMAERGLVDRERLAIRGRSAGGFTTLAALAFRSVFKVGISYYGVADLESLAIDTHKFESRYLDTLVGPYPGQKTLYKARSPINHLEHLDSAMILLQGLEDKVVPHSQAYAMADAVRARGLPLAMVVFETEGHGFRNAENQVQALESELSFLGQVFGFTPADPIARIPVENLPVRSSTTT